jgi:hypothetical protein
VPAPPELVVFATPAASVELAVSAGLFAPEVLVLAAIGSGAIVDTQMVTMTNDWTLPLLTSADGGGIDAVLLVAPSSVFVVDDIHAE